MLHEDAALERITLLPRHRRNVERVSRLLVRGLLQLAPAHELDVGTAVLAAFSRARSPSRAGYPLRALALLETRKAGVTPQRTPATHSRRSLGNRRIHVVPAICGERKVSRRLLEADALLEPVTEGSP
jgi:hypothetical protein